MLFSGQNMDLSHSIGIYLTSKTCWGVFVFGLGISLVLAFTCRAIWVRRVRLPYSLSPAMIPLNVGGLVVGSAFIGICLLCIAQATPFLRVLHNDGQILASAALGALLMGGLGALEDWRGVSWMRLFPLQVLAALIISIMMGPIASFSMPGTTWHISGFAAGQICTILWIVSFTNALRLLSGHDWIAKAVLFLTFASLPVIASLNTTSLIVVLSSGMAGSLLALLIVNARRPLILLGRGGSSVVGFAIGIISLAGSHKTSTVFSFWLPLLILTLQVPYLLTFGHRPTMGKSSKRSAPLLNPRLSDYLGRVLAGIMVAGLAYAVLEVMGPRTNWWFAGTARYLLLLTVFIIVVIACGLRPLKRSLGVWQRNPLFAALRHFASAKLHEDEGARAQVVLEILCAELNLAFLRILADCNGQRIEISSLYPEDYPNGTERYPLEKGTVAASNGQQLNYEFQLNHYPEEGERLRVNEFVSAILSTWRIRPQQTAATVSDDAVMREWRLIRNRVYS